MEIISKHEKDLGKGKIKISKHSKVSKSAIIDITGSVTIGSYVEISDGVRIFTHKHHWKHSRGLRKDTQNLSKIDLIIEDDVFIGTNAIIIGVSKIGKGAIIGAGAVVTKNIDEYNIVAGNPAKVIGIRENL